MRKRSGASSTVAQRLERAVFYVDESLHSRKLISAMRAAGARVEHAGGAFPFGSPDETWLRGAGKRRWIVLSRDSRIRYRLLERLAIEQAGVAAFVFTSGAATAADTAGVIVRLLPKMAAMAVSEPRPFIYTFGLAGSLTRMRVRRHRRRS